MTDHQILHTHGGEEEFVSKGEPPQVLADEVGHIHSGGTTHVHPDGTTHTHADGTTHSHAEGEVQHAHTEDGFVMHSHLHRHADGTVHNHFHRHEGGNMPHVHDDETESHIHEGEEALPEHLHAHVASHRLALEAKAVAFSYPRSKGAVFEGVSLKAYAGTMTAILGNNGAGKSTLLNLLGHIEAPTAGAVEVGGVDLASLGRREIARHIAYVSQQQRIPHLSVYDEVLLGRKPHVSWSITENDRGVVAAAIERLQLEPFVDRFCDELSGGERQKVYIARALAQETEVLLLDEPTSALDPKNQMEVLQTVREITTQTSLATIMVIHDINLALRFCDSFLLMRDGHVVAQGGIEAVTEETLAQTYDMPLRLIEFDGIKLVVA